MHINKYHYIEFENKTYVEHDCENNFLEKCKTKNLNFNISNTTKNNKLKIKK